MYEYLNYLLHILKCTLCWIKCALFWIEDHPVLVGVTVPMILGIFGVRKYAKNKRLEACFGFYCSLKLQINYLKTILDEKNMLNTKTLDSGNIYTLLYDPSIISKVCPAFHLPENDYIYTLSDCCEKIKITIMDSKCNINPSSITRSEWDNNIQIIYNFCEFIRTYQKNTSVKISNIRDAKTKSSKYKHIQFCEDFIKAIENIVTAINEVCEEVS